MKLKELIAKLQEHADRHGDLNVVINCDYGLDRHGVEFHLEGIKYWDWFGDNYISIDIAKTPKPKVAYKFPIKARSGEIGEEE